MHELENDVSLRVVALLGTECHVRDVHHNVDL